MLQLLLPQDKEVLLQELQPQFVAVKSLILSASQVCLYFIVCIWLVDVTKFGGFNGCK